MSCKATPAVSPKLLYFNYELANELGLNISASEVKASQAILSGQTIPLGSKPLAQAYSGHQFGGFSPRLGDGRALLLGEVIDAKNHRRDIQLKGSGLTPFSRGGDGKSALGPVLREYLISEAMHKLNIPTTRALAAVSTGEYVYRETPLPGGILTRVAASHIRIGTFQFGATLGEVDKLRELADYSIARHYPELIDAENPYLEFLKAVSNAQALLVARWMSVGFIHGVMNTDNMTISGETIDYGPCAFMDNYAAGTVFSSIDSQGRYAYANQPLILSWNLTRLAETLIPLVDPDVDRAVELLKEVIEPIYPLYESYWLEEMRSKIGLSKEDDQDLELINELLLVMEKNKADFTLVFRRLSYALLGNIESVKQLFNGSPSFDAWLQRWLQRIDQDKSKKEDIVKKMNQLNPIYIPRNYKVEEALSAAILNSDMTPFSELLDVLSHPFDEIQGKESYALPAPLTDTKYQTFCGT